MKRPRLRHLPLFSTFSFLLATSLSLSPGSAAFAGNFVAFGPQNYLRESGSPVTVAKSFTVPNPNSAYTLRISNGGLTDGEFEKVSSSVISLNGIQIVGPNEFNQKVTVIEKPVTLATNNQLSVELRGKPGGGITIQIIGLDNDPPNVTINFPANGATVSTSPVAVTGTATDANSGVASVLCNSAPASLSNSNFSCDVALLDGPNSIEVKAIDRAGNTGSSSISVNLIRGSAVRITSPADGDVIGNSRVLVLGEVTAPLGTEVGVTVNGIVALVSNGQFAALVPVDSSVTGLTATATNAQGTSLGNDTIAVTVQPPASELLFLNASPANGPAPLTVNLRASFLGPATNYQWDVDGNGTIDLQGSTLAQISQEYLTPGLYFPTVTVTDNQGSQFTETVPLLVFSQAELVALLQAKWQSLKDALQMGDIEGGLKFIAEESRDRYRGIFNTVSPRLPQVDSILTDIQLSAIRQNEAEFAMLRASADGVERSLYILFVLDNDGIWRLRVF